MRKFILPSLFAIVLFALSMVGIAFPGLVPTETLWDGHYTLLVPEEADPATVVAALDGAGFANVLSETTGLVSYNAVVGIRRLPVGHIHTRFESVDPRVDPYMARLPAYFHTLNGRRPMRIYYLEASGSGIAVYGMVAAALAGTSREFLLVEWGFGRAALLLCAFACYALVLVLRTGGERAAVAVAAAIWAPWVIAGSVSTFIVACLSIFLFALWIEELVPLLRRLHPSGGRVDARRLAVRTGFCALSAGAIVSALLISGRDGFSAFVFAGGGSLLVAGGLAYYYRRYGFERDHPPFEPVDIIRPSLWNALRGRHASPVVSIAPFVIVPLLVLAFLPKTHSPFVPEPKDVIGVARFDKTSFSLLWTHEEQNELPNLAGYLAHRSYQEGFLYGAAYELPDGQLSMTRFEYEANRMKRWEEPVVVYDEEWYEAALANTIEPSVARLLARQGRPVAVVFTPVAVIFAREATLPGHFALILLVFAPFVVSFTPAVSLDLLLRGRRQEA